jgi:hypothetical protein
MDFNEHMKKLRKMLRVVKTNELEINIDVEHQVH